MHQAEPPRPREDDATWPYASIILFGYFGAHTPEGRRLAVRTMAGILVVAVAILILELGVGGPWITLVAAVAIPAGVALIILENARYLRRLDELSRSLQVQAFAVGYGAAMLIMAALLAIHLAVPSTWGLHQIPMVALLVMAEPIRGAALARLARRHE